jgi:enoyl-[acyl-carrier protein] reductase I
MGLLDGRKALVFGVANDHSIAWGIAKALRPGATGFPRWRPLERRVRPRRVDRGTFVEPADVQSDEDVAGSWTAGAGAREIDILVHAVAHARREDLEGSFLATSRDGFLFSLDVSAYSLIAMTRAARPLLHRGSSVLTLTYLGSGRVTTNYNVMGVAKAALEASVRYLAADLGPDGIRVNAISAGPIRTLSASGVRDFRKLWGPFDQIAPMRAHVTKEDVGNTAVFLCSDLAGAITGEITFVDGGFNIMGVPSLD